MWRDRVPSRRCHLPRRPCGRAGLPLATGLRGPRGRGSRGQTLGGAAPAGLSGCGTRRALGGGRGCRAFIREGQRGETEAAKNPGAVRFSFTATAPSPGAPFVPRPQASQLEFVPSPRHAARGPSARVPAFVSGPTGRPTSRGLRARGAPGPSGGAANKGGTASEGDKALRGSAAAPGPRRRLRAQRSQWAGAGRGPAGAAPR